MVWIALTLNVTVQQLVFFRSVFGPLPVSLCHVNSILRNALPMHGLQLLDAILIVKYVFLFRMKNPTALQDDFWKMFLNIWTGSLTLISQAIQVMTPGPLSPNLFVCIGRYPNECLNCDPKKNYPVLFILSASVLIYSIVGLRFFHYKYITRQEHGPRIGFQIQLNKDTLVSFSTNGLFVTLFLTCYMVLRKVNVLPLESLNDFPNDMRFYTMYHILPSVCTCTVGIIYFVKTKELRRHVWQEVCESARGFYV